MLAAYAQCAQPAPTAVPDSWVTGGDARFSALPECPLDALRPFCAASEVTETSLSRADFDFLGACRCREESVLTQSWRQRVQQFAAAPLPPFKEPCSATVTGSLLGTQSRQLPQQQRFCWVCLQPTALASEPRLCIWGDTPLTWSSAQSCTGAQLLRRCKRLCRCEKRL